MVIHGRGRNLPDIDKKYQLSVRRVKKIKKIFAGCLELMFLQPNT